MTFASDNRTLASASEDSTLRLWDTDTANEIATLAGESSSLVNVLASSPDGVPLTAWNEETARMLSGSTADPARIRALTSHRMERRLSAVGRTVKLKYGNWKQAGSYHLLQPMMD